MIFQPAIIALLLAGAVTLAMLLAATPFAVEVIRHWDIASGSERQLRLERRTYLFSTLLVFVLAVQAVALLLFVFNADRMAAMFVGAMCAVGTLNVNGYGFPALLAQIAVFFLAAVWLAINGVDNRAPDYPLTKVKYGLLLAAAPVLAVSLGLQLQYFLHLNADVITSCCGSLFSQDAHGLSSDLAALPPKPAMIGFYAALAVAVAAAGHTAWHRTAGYVTAAASALAFAVAIAGIVSFLSLYVYEHPHHHCPFCLLKPEYDWQGYWLYLPLFAATAAGLSVGAVQPFRRIDSLKEVVPATAARLAAIAVIGYIAFTAVATFAILNSRLMLLE